MCKQNVQIIASNGSIIKAYRLVYRTAGGLTPTFSVCIEDSIDNAKWCTADN